MTIRQLLKKGVSLLAGNNIDNGENEARWLLEDCLHLTSSQIYLNGEKEVDKKDEDKYLNLLSQRLNGRPLQYIFGSWEFYGKKFFVGEGVLIPRPETELLVDFALEEISNIPNPVVTDLCAGTGCIGLTIATQRKDATVYLVEKYSEAFLYLERNNEKYSLKNTVLIKGDVFSLDKLDLPLADIVVSNPPYINSAYIKSLQSEVLREPSTALDGGEDGLIFYREIIKHLPKISKGKVAFECGENQAQDIIAMLPNGKSLKDFNGIARVVYSQGD